MEHTNEIWLTWYVPGPGPGDTVNVRASAVNVGTGTIDDVVIETVLPDEILPFPVGLTNGSCPNATCDPRERVTLAVPTLAPGASADLLFPVVLPAQPDGTIVSFYGWTRSATPLRESRGEIGLVDARCSDGFDNDGDGLVDLEDPGCDSEDDASEKSAALPCDDGIDDDGDGGTDFFADLDGDGRSDPPGDLGCRSPSSLSESPACQDGVDNDSQIGTDFDGGESVLGIGNGDPNGADPQCTQPWRTTERPSSGGTCGLGPELVVLLPLLWTARRRRLARSTTAA